jgi:hypothetical protein
MRLADGAWLPAHVTDLSEGGALVAGEIEAQAGMAGVMTIDAIATELPFTVWHATVTTDGTRIGVAFRSNDQCARPSSVCRIG